MSFIYLRKFLVLLVFTGFLAACGGSSGSGSATATDVTGTWTGDITFSYDDWVDVTNSWSVTLTQTGTTVTSSDWDGVAGTVNGSTFTIVNSKAGCDSAQTGTVIFTVSGNTMTATGGSGIYCIGAGEGRSPEADSTITGASGTLMKS